MLTCHKKRWMCNVYQNARVCANMCFTCLPHARVYAYICYTCRIVNK